MLKNLKINKQSFWIGVLLTVSVISLMGHARPKMLKVLGQTNLYGDAFVGIDGTGRDLTMYTDVASEEFFWDASANSLSLDGSNGATVLAVTDGNVVFTDNLTVTGTTTQTGAFTVGTDGSGADVTFFTTTATEEMLWDASDGALELDGTDGSDVLTISDGNITLTDDMNIDGVLTTDGINASVILVTDATPYTVLVANSGMVHVIQDLSQNTVIDLPAEAAGLFYRFVYADAAVETHDHTIDSEAAANFFIGGFSFLDTDAGDAADEVHLGIYSDGNSNSIATLNNLATGTWLEFYCDGTNWILNGQILSDTIPTLTDQP